MDPAVGCVGLCLGKTHDFIVAQHAVHFIVNDEAGMLMPHNLGGAWDDIARSAITNRTLTVNRLCTLD